MSFNYRMVKCSRCGATSALEYGICQRCGHELKKPNSAFVFLMGFAAAVSVIVALGLLMYLTQGTVLGDFLAIGILIISSLVSIVSYIWLIVAAFRVSGLWGIAVIFFPIAQLGFLYKYTDRALVPFTLSFVSLILLLISGYAVLQ